MAKNRLNISVLWEIHQYDDAMIFGGTAVVWQNTGRISIAFPHSNGDAYSFSYRRLATWQLAADGPSSTTWSSQLAVWALDRRSRIKLDEPVGWRHHSNAASRLANVHDDASTLFIMHDTTLSQHRKNAIKRLLRPIKLLYSCFSIIEQALDIYKLNDFSENIQQHYA